MSWALVPAAGSGRRFGGEIPKQYLMAAGKPLIRHALDALLAHPDVAGAVVALAPDDPHWPGWTTLQGKPVLACVGGGERADSVLAALQALPADVAADALVLVHDAARPLLRQPDLPARWQAGSWETASCVSCGKCYDVAGNGCFFVRAAAAGKA